MIFIHYINLFINIQSKWKELWCYHIYHYWNSEFYIIVPDDNNSKTGKLKPYPSVERLDDSHRQCKICGRKQRLNMEVSNWHWESYHEELPPIGNPVKHTYNPSNLKTLDEKRDTTIDSILE